MGGKPTRGWRCLLRIITHSFNRTTSTGLANEGKMFDNYAYLYVEDDPFSREVMQMLMENAMDVRSLMIFDDSADFMERMQSLPHIPDVILLDIHVRPYDGF